MSGTMAGEMLRQIAGDGGGDVLVDRELLRQFAKSYDLLAEDLADAKDTIAIYRRDLGYDSDD